MKEILNEAKALQDILIKHRRYLHARAEVGDDLPVTAAYVMARLKEMGYEPKEISKCGIVAVAGKKPGKTILLRADMDALPVTEQTDLEFKSATENMHACGHDLHTSMLLGAAQLLKAHEDELEGQVKFMFQPAEEPITGAKAMVDAGVLEDPHVDAAIMIHVFPGTAAPTGSILIPQAGVFSSASDWYKITVQGKGGHGATPEASIDPLNVITHIYLAMQEINAREISPSDQVALTVGQIHGGNTSNVIPDTAFLSGTLRTFNAKTREFVKMRLQHIAEATAAVFRAKATLEYERGCPSVEIDKQLRDKLAEYTVEVFGEDKLVQVEDIMGGPKMTGSEDFSYISERVPAVMVILSAGSPEEGYNHTVHHPKTLFNEDVMPTGVALFVNSAIEWLKRG